MKIYWFFLTLAIYHAVATFPVQKSAYESKFESRPFYTQNREDLSEAEYARDLKEKLAGNDFSKNKYTLNNEGDNLPMALYERDKVLKRSAANSFGLGAPAMKGYDRLFKRDLRSKAFRGEEGYGIVFGNGKPVGILEPYPQAFEFEPWTSNKEPYGDMPSQQGLHSSQQYADNYYLNNRIASPIDGDMEKSESDVEDAIQFTNDKYPSIYNDFKINSELYKRNNPSIIRRAPIVENANLDLKSSKLHPEEKSSDSSVDASKNEEGEVVKVQEGKRSNSGITDDQVEQLKTTLSRIQNPGPSDTVEEIERSLRSILSDMGLVSEEEKDIQKNKRSVDNSLLDVAKTYKEDENLEEGLNKIDLVRTQRQPSDRSKREDEKAVAAKSLDVSLVKHVEPKMKEATFLEEEVKANVPEVSNRVKKDTTIVKVADYTKEGEEFIRNKRQEVKSDSNDLMKGLEKSGELTVSGNKSPLASSENEVELLEKKLTTCRPSVINKREQDEVEYQKHVEQMIQAKIDAIKEQVKREIEAISTKEALTKNQDTQRRKREASNTLIDEETKDVDPQTHPDSKLLPHVRRRRYLEDLPALKRVKRGLLDFSNLKDIDSGDYLEANNENRDERHAFPDYQLDPQENKVLSESNIKADNKRDSNSNVNNENANVKDDSNNANAREDLSANENELLNVNSQDDGSMQGDSLHIKERSVTDSDLPLATAGVGVSSVVDAQRKMEILAQQKDRDDEKRSIEDPNLVNENAPAPNEEAKNNDESSEKRDINSVAQSEEDHSLFESSKIDKTVEKLKPLQSESKTNGDSLVGQKEERKKAAQTGGSKEQEVVNQEKREATSEKCESSQVGEKADKEKEEGVSSVLKKRQQAEEELMKQPGSKFKRIKRANDLMADHDVAYFPYRSDNLEVDDEGDEFDDDSLDDRTMEKRQANFNVDRSKYRRSVDYQNSLEDYEVPDELSAMNSFRAQRKRSLNDQYQDMLDGLPNNFYYQPQGYVRRKRHDMMDNTASYRGGAGMMHHIASIRDRNVQQLKENERNKRTFRHPLPKASIKDAQSNIADFSDEDLFGALPQNYNGELSRFKRVKRTADREGVEKG